MNGPPPPFAAAGSAKGQTTSGPPTTGMMQQFPPQLSSGPYAQPPPAGSMSWGGATMPQQPPRPVVPSAQYSSMSNGVAADSLYGRGQPPQSSVPPPHFGPYAQPSATSPFTMTGPGPAEQQRPSLPPGGSAPSATGALFRPPPTGQFTSAPPTAVQNVPPPLPGSGHGLPPTMWPPAAGQGSAASQALPPPMSAAFGAPPPVSSAPPPQAGPPLALHTAQIQQQQQQLLQQSHLQKDAPFAAPGTQQVAGSGAMSAPPQFSPAVSSSLAIPRVPSGSELLPRPFHGQGQYSHMKHVGLPSSRSITPVNPDTPSPRSSRVASPVPSQQFDNLEGQFSNSPAPTPRDMYSQGFQGSPGASPRASSMSVPEPSMGRTAGPGQLPPMTQLAPSGRPAPYYNVGAMQQPPMPAGQQPGHLQGFLHGPAPPPPGNYPQPPSSLPPQPYAGGMLPPPMPGGLLPPGASVAGMPPAAGFAAMSLNSVPPELRTYNLMQEKTALPPEGVSAPAPNLAEGLKRVNCSPDIFRCTLSSVPQSSQLLLKARLPLGVLIHPFKDLSNLPVIQASVIVRCRACRTYINPFVTFIDQRRWRCNLCQRANELPDDFNYDPVSKTYGHPDRRPELKAATIEYIAPSEYMLRPPQPAVYLFLLDVSRQAVETGYLQSFCKVLAAELDRLPGDGRTTVGFIAYNSRVHFYSLLSERRSAPHMMTISDIDEVFLPCPEGLLVNLSENRSMVEQLLTQLPTLFSDTDGGSALGAALQLAVDLMYATGGRVTVMQATLPNVGAGMLASRETPSSGSASGVSERAENLGPATDFYKRLALKAAGQQIAIDLFFVSSHYVDMATISGISKHCGGCIHSYPGFHVQRNPAEVERFERDLTRYLTRKIGFEAVMRVRCTKGLSIHTFHGNFFVRSTDLLALPNVNPDAGFGMQVSIEESLTEITTVAFQAALLYTSSKGERRIRVHTLCLPVTTSVNDIITGADQQAVVGLLAKMAVDRSQGAGVAEAREALVNAAVDALTAFGSTLAPAQRSGALPCPYSLRLLPLYVVAMLKSVAFRIGSGGPKLDTRVFAMEQCKSLPLARLMLMLHPDLYPVHALTDEGGHLRDDEVIPQPPRLSLSSANIDRHGAYLLDTGDFFYVWIGSAISENYCRDALGCPNFASVPDGLHELPSLENPTSSRVRLFISYLRESRTNHCPMKLIREDSMSRPLFMQHMVEDKTESTTSYYEFLQHMQKQIKP